MTGLVLEAAPDAGRDDGAPRVHLGPAGGAARETVAASLRRAGIELTTAGRGDGAVRVAAGRTPGAALDGWPEPGGGPLLLVADTFTAAGVRLAVRAGVVAILQSAEATPERLLTAVRAARCGEGRMSYGVLARLLDEAGGEAEHRRPVPDSPLTARQKTVLALVAEGHGNAAIARELSCSQHTVKNVMYDLMTRLQVRNRAHAVAHGVRTGLI
ncbi:response regulator transcription factor [Streptomyces phaeoluteigriseus]|uniref:Response regulator transcription factor n=1 Tax=Streptomyces phaeoluteigriseus TaxID=114686 RepID=A0ABY4ZG83_9ACTN|nr:response regulator transcription factor [Streptomyces phaeoluteigriseus]USQ87986.1 response regulator transcription factor [Streptomyces phaeoluteigriseus]